MKLIYYMLVFSSILFATACQKNENIKQEVPVPEKPKPIDYGAKKLNENQVSFTSNTVFYVDSLNLLKSGLEFKTTAIGRASKQGIQDNPLISLFNDSYTHPSIVKVIGTEDDYKYWLALTPFFGKTLQLKDNTSCENPHIFKSKDGINWIEPDFIKNPLDTAYNGPNISYWSDTNLIRYDGKFFCFYRGNGFPTNYFGDKKNHFRSVVVRESTDGVNWSNRKLVYSTLSKGIDDNSGIVSPSFIVESNSGKFICYDVVLSSKKHPISPQKNQTSAFVMRRESDNINSDYEEYNPDNIVNFINKPWLNNQDPWHLEVKKFNGMFFMLLNVGLTGKENGESLYFAYSSNGKDFYVLEKPLFANNTYKSTMLVTDLTDLSISFNIYQSEKGTGRINLYKLDLKYLNNAIKK